MYVVCYTLKLHRYNIMNKFITLLFFQMMNFYYLILSTYPSTVKVSYNVELSILAVFKNNLLTPV